MPSVIIGVDRSGKTTHWNRNAEILFGTVRNDAIGKELKSLLPFLKVELEELVSSPDDLTEQRLFRKSRQEESVLHYYEITIYPLSSSAPGGAVIRIDDITEQVRMQETMIQSEKMLSVGGLAAGMAHEINNPLAGIMQTAEVLGKRLTDQNMSANAAAAEKAGIQMENLNQYLEERGINKMLKAINDSGRRAAQIIKNMLNFSRQDDSFAFQNPVKMLDDILELASTDFNLKKHFDFRNIEITREIDTDLPTVPCSESQIQQVILNILRNGTEAMHEIEEEGYKPKFTLRLIKETSFLRMEFEDNGPGIREEEQQNIFTPFYTTKPVGIGTGLGLSVSAYIIRDIHKGTIEVESVLGKGAKFIIRLPLKRD